MKKLTFIQIISTVLIWLLKPLFSVTAQFIPSDYSLPVGIFQAITSLEPPFLAVLLLLLIIRLDKFIPEITPKIRFSNLAILSVAFTSIVSLIRLISTIIMIAAVKTAYSPQPYIYNAINYFIGSLALINLYLLVLRIICPLDLIFAINQEPSL